VRRSALVLFGVALLMLPRRLAAQDHLEVLQAPQLVQCDPSPYFRMALSAVDAERKPVGISLSTGDPRKLFQVFEGDRQHPVVYVGSAGSGVTQNDYAILLLDTSGSMKAPLGTGQTRFTVARDAVRRSLANFVDGADHMAIIPFDSHSVAARIHAAEFQSTRRGVESQLDAIRPAFRKDDNTALYSAVSEALPILKARADAGFPVSLIVFTDGANDVGHPGDDRGLLGPEGLAAVRNQAATLKVPITTVGFGMSGDAKALSALREMAWPNAESYYDAASSGERLTQIFESVRRKLTDRIQILFGPVRPTRDELTGHSYQFRVRLRAGDGFIATRSEPLWDAPAVGRPVADTDCTSAETKAILETSPPGAEPADIAWKRIIILATFGAILAALWFGAPRLVWPESYIPKPTFQRPNVQLPPNVSVPPMPRPRAPNMPSMSPPPRPAPPDYGRPSAPREPTIVVPSSPSRPAVKPPPPRVAPAEPPGRGASDETLFQPPDKLPRKDR